MTKGLKTRLQKNSYCNKNRKDLLPKKESVNCGGTSSSCRSSHISRKPHSYIRCTCGQIIPVENNYKGYVICPKCQLSFYIKDTKLHISGQNASEVKEVLDECLDIIKDAKTNATHQSTNMDISGERIQINISKNDSTLHAQQKIYNSKSKIKED